MKQNCWGNDTYCWGSEAICVGETPQIQSEGYPDQTRPDQTRGVISLCIWGTSPTNFASLPQQIVSFPQQFCFSSPTILFHFPNNLLHFPNTMSHFPNTFSHFPNTILYHFAKKNYNFFLLFCLQFC